jgi:Domain of unknown function (DUF4440)
MKRILLLVLCTFVLCGAFAQKEEVISTLKQFHQSMIGKNAAKEGFISDQLSYGHSNGWLESKEDFIKDIETSYITYHSYKEDSINVVVEGNVAYARFVADIESTLKENRTTNHIRVLEVWVKQKNKWKLLVRQAVRVV